RIKQTTRPRVRRGASEGRSEVGAESRHPIPLKGLSRKSGWCGPTGVLGSVRVRAEGVGWMAMGLAKGQGATRQVEIVCLDELVAEDDLYRRIDALVDWGFVRVAAAPYYADALGRPSVDPIVLLKLMLVGALEGVGSMRELLRLGARDLSIRRFLGYGLGERLPAHQTVSDAHSCRFVDARIFEDRKSTRLNSSHVAISYAVFRLKKKK